MGEAGSVIYSKDKIRQSRSDSNFFFKNIIRNYIIIITKLCLGAIGALVNTIVQYLQALELEFL